MNGPEETFLHANQLTKDNKIVEARDILLNLVKEHPEYGRAYNHLGWIYEKSFKDYETAMGYYRQALKHAPEYPAIYSNFSYCLSTAQKFDELEALLEQALTVPGVDRATIYNEYAIMYETQTKYQLAIKYYGEYIKQVFDRASIDRAVESIERCKYKADILKDI